MGPHWERSKPKGLDVGVLPHGFSLGLAGKSPASIADALDRLLGFLAEAHSGTRTEEALSWRSGCVRGVIVTGRQSVCVPCSTNRISPRWASIDSSRTFGIVFTFLHGLVLSDCRLVASCFLQIQILPSFGAIWRECRPIPRFASDLRQLLFGTQFCTLKPEYLKTGTATTEAARDLARTIGQAGDDAGHAIAKMHGGGGGATSGNIFPQAANVNRGAFREFEREITTALQAGKEVRVEQVFMGGVRPTQITYNITIDGKTTTRVFPNP
jgi:hypothetical protein